MPKLKIRLNHQSSIPGAIWCEPIGWEPTNEIEGADYFDSGWWDDVENVAGIVAFVDGDQNEVIECDISDLRIASCGDCRIIGEVEIDD